MASDKKATLLQGSLDMLILQSLRKEARHGYSIAKHLKDVSEDFLKVEEGSLYPALHRLEKEGALTADWTVTPAGRRARLYKLTVAGRKRLAKAREEWAGTAKGLNRLLRYA